MNEDDDLIVGRRDESPSASDGSQTLSSEEGSSLLVPGQVQPPSGSRSGLSAVAAITAAVSTMLAKNAQAQSSGLTATPPVGEFHALDSITINVQSTTSFQASDVSINISGPNASWFEITNSPFEGWTMLTWGTSFELVVAYVNTTSVNCVAYLNVSIGSSTLPLPLYGLTAASSVSPSGSGSSWSADPGFGSSSSSSASDSSGPDCSCCDEQDIPS